MEPPWSDRAYTGDVPQEFEEVRIREERKERISQYWDLLVADKEPQVNRQALLLLMQDLKDEGNTLFKELQFDVAWMHYRNALFIAKILETRFYHEVDKEFVSTLFSNRAFCCLKKEMYIEAIQDCESAIQIHSTNVKAYYRQVLALKAQNRFQDALKVAEKGFLIKQGVFKEQIEELKEITSAEKSKAKVSAKDARALSKDAPDSEWLSGTNIHVTKKNEQQKSKSNKKGKGKSNSKQQINSNSNNSNNKIKALPKRNGGMNSSEDSSVEGQDGMKDKEDTEEEEEGLSEDEKFANTFANIRNIKLQSPGRDFYTKAFTNLDLPTSPPQMSATMGLDNFSPPAQGNGTFKPEVSRASNSSSSVSSPQKSAVSKPVQQMSPKAGTPAFTSQDSQEIKKLTFPLENYEFKLACNQCFVKTGEGVKGYRHIRGAPHDCIKDVLLVKLMVQKVGINWIKVRCRPDTKLQQFGGYKLCAHFVQGHPCKVGEERCTFAHNKAELDLWTMDREGSFDIKSFKSKTLQYGADNSEKLYNLQQSCTLPKSSTGIPGLNFKQHQGETGKPQLAQTQTAPILPQNQHVLPPKSQPPEMPARQTLLPTPGINTPRIPPPQHLPPHYFPPASGNYSFPPPRGPMHYGFSQRPPHGMPPPGMRYPPHNVMRGRFPPPNYQMDNNFSTPTSQAQIRPNLGKRPEPKPVTELPKVQQDSQLMKQEFPLKDTHEFKLACKECFREGNAPGSHVYMPNANHKCGENNLIVRARQAYAQWNRVRERKNHRVFTGRYIICNSVYHGSPALCRFGEETCSFAHNEDEQKLWTLEKDEKFDITEFIMQCREKPTQKGYGLPELLSRHVGYLSFICKACFYFVPQMINREGADGKCSGPSKHTWKDYRILSHFSTDGKVTVVNPRGFLHKSAFFKICKWLHFCKNRVNAECRFAHSLIERDIWMFERDSNLTQDEIVEQANKHLGITSHSSDVKQVTTEITPSDTLFQVPPVVKKGTSSRPSPSSESINVDEDHDDLFPYNIQELCQTCWRNGKKSMQDGDRDRCVKNHSNWARNRVYLLVPSNKELRPLPRIIPKGFHFIICKYIRERGKCGYTGNGHCQFAHCQEELEAWQWMCSHELMKVEDLFQASKEAQKLRNASSKNKITGGESVVSVSKVRTTVPMQISKFSPHYCSYCGKQCNSEKQWEEHCASERHMFNVNSDKEHQWNYRQPPWGIPASNYEICFKHIEGNKCQYSNVPDIYNLCQYAHSNEELDEWRERYEWRQMKREMARQEKVFSFMDELLEQYEEADSGIQVICEEQDDVVITCEQELNIYEEEKNATFLWTFEVKTKRILNRVALLYNKDRLHFSLLGPDHDQANQIAPGNQFEDVDNKGLPIYRIHVQFTGTMFGSFSQWVIFDFGTMPVLAKKLSVEVGSTNIHDKVRSLREKFQFDRWTSENRRIEKFSDHIEESERKLLNRYKAPSSSESVITQHSIIQELNCNNYRHKMRKLLEMEEIARHQIISSYNLVGKLELTNVIQEGTYVYAQPGELFAKVPLSEYLSEDTDAGKLILTSVRKVLLAPCCSTGSVVYEAVIVHKENFNYDGRGKEHIYLCLSPGCITDLGLRHGGSLEVEIQFTMDRMWFCRMYYAVDQLKTTDIVFPDVSKINPLNEKQVLRVSSQILNPDQIQAVQHIVTERFGYTPPFVIYGPFGTGKTETIAQAVMVLLREKPTARVLICAQSNSAADLYVIKHLDPFLRKSTTGAKLRRVYFKERRVNTVAPEVKKYCILSRDQSAFDSPTAEDIKNHNVVIVTLSTSLLLTDLGLQGYFTHIFLDEAAQALEAETIMPLCLATEKTCIVVAGDHQQISPKVYSVEACSQKLDVSLIERLFVYYESFSYKIDQASPLNILLSINYRTKMEILRFISSIFYGGPDKLVSRANLPSVLGITPLMFYAVQGVEVQDSDSISFYNTSEVQEVVERVQELYNQWPTQWGERKAKEIGVVTPYYDQVQLIRKALRKKHPDLGKVTVERVNNVQGKEFRALFISTVRTRSLINSPLSGLECEGDGGDFGFLSDSKLLNTALTRAQSFVAVVGDPVALCAIGDCLNVWRTYLKHCQNMKSINPQSLTLESIKQQVSNLLNSPARERMIQMANQRKQASKAPLVIPVEPVSTPAPLQLTPWTKKVEAPSVDDNLSLENEIVNDLFNGINLQSQVDTFFSENGREKDLPLEMIFKQMVMEIIRDQKEQDIEGRTSNKTGIVPLTESIQMKLVNLRSMDNNVVLTYDDNSREIQKEIPELVDRYNDSQLKALLLSDSNWYKHCILNSKNAEDLHAKVLDPSSFTNRIVISNQRKCHKAFHGDEVVVEITPPDSDLETDKIDDVVQGKVVGILQHHIERNNRLFVCLADTDNPGMLIPIRTGVPKLHNLLTPSQLQRTKKGNVSVYKIKEDNTVVFSQYVKVDPYGPSEKLFVVRFLTWDSRFQYPIGIVIGMLQAGVKINTGMNVLNLEYGMKKSYRPQTEMEVSNLYPPAYNLPALEYTSCLDFRAKWTFSINSEKALEIPTALSIEEMNDGNYVIGVHVTDVAHHIIKGTNMDLEAEERGFTCHISREDSINILPPKLSTDILSLKKGVDRLTLSIFLTVSKTGEILQAIPKRCVINSKQTFNYQDVEQILHDPNASSDYLKSCVIVLYHISRIWRRQRLGNASMYQDIPVTEKLAPEAHLMYHELMINTNHHVGRLLLENFPDITPLYLQSPPNEGSLEDWKQEHASDSINSVALTKPFLEGSKICSCKVACTCIINYIKAKSIKIKDSFHIYSVVWDKVCHAADIGDASFIQNVITAAESHPQLAVAVSKLNNIQNQATYVCSSEAIDKKHYNLNLAPYVHFTNPLNCYIDICSHRLITSVVENSPAPYTQEEMQHLCQTFTHKAISHSDYLLLVQSLNLSVALKTKPLTLNCIIESISDQRITLCCPSLPYIPDTKRQIDVSLLGPSEKPIADELNQSLIIKWQEKHFDPTLDGTKQDGNSMVELNPCHFIVKIPSFQWQKLLMSIREENQEKLLQTVQTVKELVKTPSLDPGYSTKIPVEQKVKGKLKLFSEFCTRLSIGRAFQVQVVAESFRGVVTPIMQLLAIADNHHVCVQHRSNPVQCFTSSPSAVASRSNYSDEISYQNAWLSVLEIEAAYTAISSNNSITIHNVLLQWRQETLGMSVIYTATFELPIQFLKERHIKEPWDMNYYELFESSNVHVLKSFFNDLLCVRCHNLQLQTASDAHPDIAVVTDDDDLVTWVAHCVVLMVREINNKLQVKARLHQSSVHPPPQILHPSASKLSCTIEWIQKSSRNRNMDYAVRSVQDSSHLSRDIARGRSPVQTVDYRDIELLGQIPVPGLPHLDSSQKAAISAAMQQPFTLISGPPGSGKTLTGVRLAFMLAQRNKTFLASGIKPQVLICGPTEQSLDVIIDNFLKLGDKCPRILRIYSTEIVQEEFPVPGRGMELKTAVNKVVDCNKSSLALHHKIRSSDSMFGSSIQQFDMLFQLYPNDIIEEQMEEYFAMVTKAEIIELREAEILVTTCISASSARMKDHSNVHQIIIDECGACSEPESMVPICLNRNTKQITLIGDPEQLGPDIKCNIAKDLGLDKSLLERNADKIIHLAKQYRMHKKISDLHAEVFYNLEFESGSQSQEGPPTLNIWPGDGKIPSVFCHVSGVEEKMILENLRTSYRNHAEITLALNLATRLVIGQNIKEDDIVIMTPYRSQADFIQRKVSMKGHKGIHVKTISECQGRGWGYVILTTTRSVAKSRVESQPCKEWLDSHLGPVSDPHHLNLALTRAKDGLIVIGNQYLLSSDVTWQKILSKYIEGRRLLNGQDFLRLLL